MQLDSASWLLGGLGQGLAGLSAAPGWVALPVYPLFLIDWRAPFKRWRRLVAFGVGAGFCGLVQAGYNLVRFGSPLETGHALLGATRRLALAHLCQVFSGVSATTSPTPSQQTPAST